VGNSSVYAPFPEMLIKRACADVGLDGYHCKSDIDGVQNPRYDDAQKASSQTLVYMMVAQGTASLISCGTVGVFGDAYGRKAALFFPLIGSLLSTACVWLLPPSQQNWMTVGITVGYLGGGLYAPVHLVFAMLADVTMKLPTQTRTLYFATVESSFWMGQLLGPLIGGSLAKHFGDQQMFFFPGLISLLALAILVLLVEETLEIERREPFTLAKANPLSNLWMLTGSGSALGLSLVVLLVGVVTSGSITISPFYMEKQFDSNQFQVGGFQAVLFGVSAVGLLFFLPIASRYLQPKTIVLIAIACNAITNLGYGLASSVWQLYLVAGSGILCAVYYPIVRTLVAETFGRTKYGASLGALSAVQQITQLVAPSVCPPIYSATESMTLGPVRGVTYLVLASVASAGFFVALLTPVSPKVEEEAKFEKVAHRGSFQGYITEDDMTESFLEA